MVITAAVTVIIRGVATVYNVPLARDSNQPIAFRVTKTNAQLVPVFPGHVDPLMCIVGWSYMNYGVFMVDD